MQADTLLLALLCGHFFGDFALQTNGLAERKAKNIVWMLFHVFLVAAMTWIPLGTLGAWWIAGILLPLHLLIDCMKLRFNRSNPDDFHTVSTASPDRVHKSARDLLWFVGDQALHITVIAVLWFCVTRWDPAASLANHWSTVWGSRYDKGLLLLCGLVVCVWGIGVILKYQMARFAAELPDKVKQGLPKGGRTIGMLERLLAFMFVLSGKPEGVGFVVAAKSIFRIGDLTRRDDRNHAEYIMIGTLRSFAYALAVAFVTKWLIGNIR